VKNLPGRADGTTRAILVVDDDQVALDFVCRALAQRGYHVVPAATADHAHEVFGSTNIDLLLTDINLPATDGVQLADNLARVRPDLPVIFMSGDPARHDLWQRPRRVIFLRKPFKVSALWHEVEQILEP
jgi:two-component system cell cycle sensor histidine kinase/response regulator CckA